MDAYFFLKVRANRFARHVINDVENGLETPFFQVFIFSLHVLTIVSSCAFSIGSAKIAFVVQS